MAVELQQPQVSARARLLSVLERMEDEAAFDIGLRSGMRRAVHAPVTLGVIAGGYKPLYKGWATDLSMNGLGLLTEHDVPMNAVLYVNLEAVAGEELLLPVRVCYVSRLLSKTYRIGGTFELPATDAEQALLFG